ncbi:MAG: hypothetical protein GF307_08675 [candidate division Zixibacteria bacterium]|nr:hypothetical protein [candidate division Zixibacteria bacterium]
MALDESVEGLNMYESNGVETYMDPDLYSQLTESGTIQIDFIEDQYGRKGFTINTGSGGCCG